MTLQTEELRRAWSVLFPDKPPDDAQWGLWEFLHEPAIVRSAIGQLAVRYRKMGGMSLDHMIRFASAVMNRLEREQHHGSRTAIRGTVVPGANTTALAIH